MHQSISPGAEPFCLRKCKINERETTLHFISDRLASGKTTLAGTQARQEDVVLICEDVWLAS
jgi:hypothetical protein